MEEEKLYVVQLVWRLGRRRRSAESSWFRGLKRRRCTECSWLRKKRRQFTEYSWLRGLRRKRMYYSWFRRLGRRRCTECNWCGGLRGRRRRRCIVFNRRSRFDALVRFVTFVRNCIWDFPWTVLTMIIPTTATLCIRILDCSKTVIESKFSTLILFHGQNLKH